MFAARQDRRRWSAVPSRLDRLVERGDEQDQEQRPEDEYVPGLHLDAVPSRSRRGPAQRPRRGTPSGGCERRRPRVWTIQRVGLRLALCDGHRRTPWLGLRRTLAAGDATPLPSAREPAATAAQCGRVRSAVECSTGAARSRGIRRAQKAAGRSCLARRPQPEFGLLGVTESPVRPACLTPGTGSAGYSPAGGSGCRGRRRTVRYGHSPSASSPFDRSALLPRVKPAPQGAPSTRVLTSRWTELMIHLTDRLVADARSASAPFDWSWSILREPHRQHNLLEHHLEHCGDGHGDERALPSEQRGSTEHCKERQQRVHVELGVPPLAALIRYALTSSMTAEARKVRASVVQPWKAATVSRGTRAIHSSDFGDELAEGGDHRERDGERDPEDAQGDVDLHAGEDAMITTLARRYPPSRTRPRSCPSCRAFDRVAVGEDE